MIGLAMVFVLLTFGGWNEAAYLSADLKNVKRDMIRILLIGTAVVTVLYVAINMAYLAVLGLEHREEAGLLGQPRDLDRVGRVAAPAVP